MILILDIGVLFVFFGSMHLDGLVRTYGWITAGLVIFDIFEEETCDQDVQFVSYSFLLFV